MDAIMARTGRPRSNPQLLEAQGSYKRNPGRKPDADKTIKAITGRPEPTMLVQTDDLTVAIWDDTCNELESLGILAVSDRFLIEAYVLNLREFYKLTQYVQASGHAISDDRGLKTDPNVVSYHKIMDRHIKLMGELALTPQARLRMTAPTVESDAGDDITKLLGKLGGK